MRQKYLLLLFLCLWMCAGESRAELASLFGVGPQSEAMGACSLLEGRASAYQVYSAPAALGFLHRVEISAGAQYMAANLRPFGTVVLDSSGTLGQYKSAGVRDGGGSVLAFAFPIGKQRPLTLAGTFYLPFGTLVRVSGSPVDFPFYPLYNDISGNFYFVLGAGYEFLDGWALGINLRSTTKSTAYYKLVSNSSVNYSASAVEARGQTRFSVSLLYDHGRQYEHQAWSVGLMVRAPSAMETKLSADITAFVPVQGALLSVPFYSPAEFVVMGSKKFGEFFIVSADLARVKWSDYVSPYGSGNINSYVIGSAYERANFHDIWVPKLGMEWKTHLSGKLVQELDARAGYQYHPSPVPDQNADTNFVDNTRHMFSAGLGVVLDHPWQEQDTIAFDSFLQWNFLKQRNVHKNLATNIGAPGYPTGGSIWLFGGAVTLKF